MKKQLTLIIFIVVAVVAVVLATGDSGVEPGSQNKVGATIFPVYDIASEIAGDEFEVVLMLPAGASPHTFDPQPSTIKDLEGSRAVFAIGHGLDNWATSIADSIGAPVITLDSGIDLRENEDHHDEHDHEGDSEHEYEDEHDEGHEGHNHGPIDPHYWLSIHNAQQIAMNIAEELSALDTINSALYIQRAESYVLELEALKVELRESVSGLSNKNILSLHDAWFYFAEDFGLNLVGTFESSAGTDPTPQDIQKLQEEIKERGISVIFSEPQLSSASIESFANDNNLGLATLDPLGGVEGRFSYIELMRYNIDQVINTLDK